MRAQPEARDRRRQLNNGLLFPDSLAIRSFSNIFIESRYFLQQLVVPGFLEDLCGRV